MSYLNVISLQDAKTYLGIDDTLNEDDAQITRMINAALSFVEKWTGIFVFDRDIAYKMVNGCVKVSDAPINAVVGPTPIADIEVEEKTLHNNYQLGSETVNLILNVGYDDPLNVPQDLVEIAYQIIDIYYNGRETGKTITQQLDTLSIDVLNQNKRYTI